MKKNLLSSFLAAVFTFTLYAQTNLDFETWTGNEPDGWVTYNFLTQLGAAQSTFKETTDPGESTASAKMVTVNCTACPNFGLPATLGGIVTSGIIGPPPALGVAYTGRPTSADFQYKANPVSGDAGIVFVQLSRWDAGASQKVIIGQGYLLANTQVTTWTSYNLPIQYANGDIPDTLMIMASSSAASAVQGLPGSGTPAVGSEFFVDSLVINDPCAASGLTVTVTGTNETVAGANDGTASATVTGGSPAYTYSWSNGATTSTVSGLSPGTYTVAIIDANGCATTGSYTVVSGPAGIVSSGGSGFISVYPVPAKNNLFFEISGNAAEQICVFDVTGRDILTVRVSGKLTAVPVENIPSGIFFYQIRNENSDILHKGKFSVVR